MKKNKLIIFLDPAHGEDVAGKRSPDGLYREFAWSRGICADLDLVLSALGYEVQFTNHSTKEIGLDNRRKYAENFKTDKHKLLLSIHSNAAGNGSVWTNATGVEIFTKQGIDKADVFGELFFHAAKNWFPNIKHRYATNELYGKDKESNLFMTNSNKYFGVLIEWLFHDNKEDVRKLQNSTYNKALVDCIVDAVEAFNDTL